MFMNGSKSGMATFAIAVLALTACSKKESASTDTTAASSTVSADTSAMSASAPAAGTWTDANIVALLDEANVGDSTAGAVAATKGTAAAVRDFAKRMMRDHHQLRVQGQALAKKLNLATKAASQTQTAELKNLIQKAAPVIRGHLDKAESIQKTLK